MSLIKDPSFLFLPPVVRRGKDCTNGRALREGQTSWKGGGDKGRACRRGRQTFFAEKGGGNVRGLQWASGRARPGQAVRAGSGG